MKKIIFFICFSTFIFLSCERTDIYDDATSYASIYAWFTPEDAKADGTGNVYYWPDKDGRDLFLYNDATSGPSINLTIFNSKKSILFSAPPMHLKNQYFQLNPPMSIIVATHSISNGVIFSNSSSPSALNIANGASNLNFNTSEISIPDSNLSLSEGYILCIIIDQEYNVYYYGNNNKMGEGKLISTTGFNGLYLATDGSGYLQGYFGDIIFFDKKINDKAREYYVDLLMDKFGI